jgi:hypothetical protein
MENHIMDFKIIGSEEVTAILGADPKRLEWGYFLPASTQTAVGARMILDRESLGYLSDRISWMGNNKDMDQQTAKKCVAIKLAETLHSFMNENGITSSSNDTIFGEIKGYQMLATPNASYGYVYMSFWAV